MINFKRTSKRIGQLLKEYDFHVTILAKAVAKVKYHYIDYDTRRSDASSSIRIKKRAERVFAYELYHQIRKQIDNKDGYYLNAEVYKNNKVFKSIDNVKSCYPDLILHGEPGEINEDTQYFLCEIKMHGNAELTQDLGKLSKLISSKLGFKYYIFLCIGLTSNELQYKIIGQKDRQVYNGDILCICRKEENIEVFRLKEIMPEGRYK